MKTVVLGCGLAGLGAGLELHNRAQEFQILEKGPEPGGLTRTDCVAGFFFDRIAQFLHFKGADLRERLRDLDLPLESVRRQAAVIVGSSVVPYPFQYNLWALPQSCRLDALEDLKSAQVTPGGFKTFEEALTGSWGCTMTELFFRPYNEKLWRRRLDELPPDCAGRYMPSVDVELAERGCSTAQTHLGYNSTCYYPATGRIGDVARALVRTIDSRVQYRFEVARIDVEGHKCHGRNGESIEYDHLISTMALPDLVAFTGMQGSQAPMFTHTRVLNVRVGFRGEMRSSFHWLYIPDPERSFYRIGFPRNVNANTCPEGCASLSIECSVENAPQNGRHNEIAAEALAYMIKLGFVEVEEVLAVDATFIAPAYVVYRSPGRDAFGAIHSRLEKHDIHVAGRFGTWDYLSMEEAFLSGRDAVSRVISQPNQRRQHD